ncbi:molybdenum cofactor guanylyltransferase [Flavobacterium sp.]|uniref:molybdenum cofactor guanylyltransferase n=1 Tax=Flavobacterium sp. TaxID=239 RepID=UPI0038FCF17D
MQISILCGGKSSRMQSEKGLVLYQNKAFIEHIIDAVLPISENIQLVTNSIEYDYLGFKIVKDIVLEKGPLGGIYSALVHSDFDDNLILSCDIPLISSQMIQLLVDTHTENVDISVFGNHERIHPLIGMYSRNLISVLKEAIDLNSLKMMDFISKNKHQLIPIEEKNIKLFKNINSVADLKAIELI